MAVTQKRLTVDEFLKLASPFVSAAELVSLRPNLIDELRDESHGSSELEDYLKILDERDKLLQIVAKQTSEIKRGGQDVLTARSAVARLKAQVNWLEDQGVRQALRDGIEALSIDHEQLKKVHAKVVKAQEQLVAERERLKAELETVG